jgi:transcriptional regulator with XRE-family HTH domain
VPVGERLRQLRQQRGLTLEELATRMDMSHPTISKMERGQAKIDADILPRFARELNVHPCDFFEPRLTSQQMTDQERVNAARRGSVALLQGDLDGVLDEFLRLAEEVRTLRGRSA